MDIAFCISSLKGETLLDLPLSKTLHGCSYVLGGLTLYAPGHYTAVVMWRGKKMFYDGLGKPRLLPLRKKHYTNKDGSFA